jgi:hypothetical protein
LKNPLPLGRFGLDCSHRIYTIFNVTNNRNRPTADVDQMVPNGLATHTGFR